MRNIKSLDYDNIHFEFGNILGIAIYKDIDFKFVIITEVDDLWFIQDKFINISTDCLSSFRRIVSRANNHIKLLKAEHI